MKQTGGPTLPMPGNEHRVPPIRHTKKSLSPMNRPGLGCRKSPGAILFMTNHQ